MTPQELPPGKNAIAICSLGILGVITSDAPVQVTYPNGEQGMAWIGISISITGQKPAGSGWSSRKPHVVGYLPDAAAKALLDSLAVH
jgi:hypothetical protein